MKSLMGVGQLIKYLEFHYFHWTLLTPMIALELHGSPPKIGGKYQVNVSPFKLRMGCDQLGMSKGKDYKDDKDEDFEQLFEEGLPIPVMHICCFSPFGNGTSSTSDNEFHSNESSLTTTTKKDCGLC